MFTSPKKFTVDNETRDAKDAGGFIFFRSKVVLARLISFRYFGFGRADVPEQPRFKNTFRKRLDHIFQVGTEVSIVGPVVGATLI